MRVKLAPAQFAPPNESLPFSGFLDLLKRRGFAAGVDRHLRLVFLLERIGGECGPDELKQLIAPLFATNEREQAQFYRVFDEYFALLRMPALWEGTGRTAVGGAKTERKPASRLRRVLSWGAVVIVLAAVVVFRAPFFHHIGPPPSPTPSATVSPTSVRSRVGKPFAPVSPTARPSLQPERAQSEVVLVLARNRTALLWIGGLMPLALFAANELRRFSKQRQLVLERTRGRKPPFTWPIRIEPRALGYLSSEQFYKVARKLRRRQIAEYHRLDIARTIDATIAASSYPTFQYRPDSRMPEYLILIDRTSARDHQAALFDQLAQALQREGIFVTRYFFDGDPRVCWSERATASVSLGDLQKIFSEHRLIIFGHGHRLIDAVTGELTKWSEMFLEWVDRALVTPAAPSAWDERERTLGQDFLVFPATLDAIEQLAERFDSGVPADLELADADDSSPPDFERDADLGKLRTYLGEPVFQWLCACATYPELHWDLTLLLGSLPALGEHLVTERNLLRLLRIPWFRAGAIPDEQRLQLLAALDPAKEVAVRAAIVRALEKSPAPEASFAAENWRLEIVLQEGLLGRRSTSELKSALRSLPLDELTRDYVLLHETRRISRLAFALPEQMRLIFFDKGISALGLNMGARIGLTSALTAAMLLTIAFLVPAGNTTHKPIGEPMIHGDTVYSAQFSPDGQRVVTASRDATARLWDGVTGKPIGKPMFHESAVMSAEFSPDGLRVVTASAVETARLWDATSGKPIGEPMHHDDQVNSARFSPDGQRIVTASWDYSARLWDGVSGKAIGEPMMHDDAVLSAEFSPNGQRVVTASTDGTARLWDGTTGKPIGEPMRHELRVNSAQFSLDGQRVVTASYDQTARLWDATSGEPIGEPMMHDSAVNSAQFSPDGQRIVTASYYQARLWDATSSKPIGQPMRHYGDVNSAKFSPDGQRVVTASLDHTARLWDANTGKPIGEPLVRGAGVNSAEFSPDGQRVVTASLDHTARLWDAAITFSSRLMNAAHYWLGKTARLWNAAITINKDARTTPPTKLGRVSNETSPSPSLPPAISPGQDEIANQPAQTNAAPVPSVEQTHTQPETSVTTVPPAAPKDVPGGIDIESEGMVPPPARAALSQALAADGFETRKWAVGKGPGDRVIVKHYFSEDRDRAESIRNTLSRALPGIRVEVPIQLNPPGDYRRGHLDIWLPRTAIKLLLAKTSQSKS